MASRSDYLRTLRRRLAFVKARFAEREAAGAKFERGDYDKSEINALTWVLAELTPRDPREELDEVDPASKVRP